MQLVAAEIEEAVFEPCLFRVVEIAEDRHGQLGRLRQHFQLVDEDLHRARRQVRVDRPFGVRAFTLPSMRITHSERTRSAAPKAGESGSATHWVMP